MKYKVAKSKIHGDGIFATQPIAKGEYISDTPDYIDNVNQTIASSFHNHDEKNANVLNVKRGNKRFLIAKRGIEVGEELTTDYNLTPSPPFEDPNDFKDLDERELSLSDPEELQALIDAGYELEELHEGGSPHSHPHEDEVTVTGSRKDPYEFGLDVNERLGQAFDIMNQNPDAIGSGSPHKYTDWYLDNYKAQDSKYTLQGKERANDDRYAGFMSNLRDYDEEQLKSYIDLYKEFIDGYQNDVDKGEEKDYTKRYLKSYKDIVSTLEDVLKNPIRPKSVVLSAELAPIIIYDKPTYKQAYKNVDKDKYPTYEDFEFAAKYYNETGTNPDSQDLPSNRLPAPPPPEYQIEDIEPDISPLPIIEPSVVSNPITGEIITPEEEVQYKRKFGFHDKEGESKRATLRNFLGYRIPELINPKKSRSIKYKTPKGFGFYEESIEDEQIYPEGFVPMFEDGGPIEMDLTPEQVKMYKNGGYVLEELPTYNNGGKFLANKVAPVFIEPSIKLIETFFPGLGRSVGSKISRMSMGDARYNYKDIINDLFREGYNKNNYYGQEGILSLIGNSDVYMTQREKTVNDYYGEDKRDLVRQYFFGDSNNMTETDWKSYLEGDDPLGDIIKRHGPLKSFEMFSAIDAGKPINAYELAEQMEIRDKYMRGYMQPIYDSKTFQDATGWKPNSGHTPRNEPNVFLDNKQGLIDIYEDQFKRFGTDVLSFDVNPASTNIKGEHVELPRRSLSYNPIRPYDDVAGHMTYLERHGLGDYSLTSRDAWHFSPKSYNSKWYDQEGYLKNLPARLMDKFGKPFILTQTNPISFDFNLFKNPTKSKLKLKKGGLVRFDNGGGVDSKLKVTTTFDKEKVDELRLRHKQFEEDNPDVQKKSFEEWLNYQLMDQRSENNPNADRKFTDYMVINEDGTASVYDGQEIQNRIWKHGRRAQQLIDAGLPEGDHPFLQEHFKRAEKDGEIRYMNHIKKGLNQGMSMDEIKEDMLNKNLISKAGWNEKYEGKTADHINTEYDKLKTEIEQSQADWKKRAEAVGSKIDPALMDVKQLQMDPYGAYRYQKPKPAPKVKYRRIAGTAHMEPIIDPSTMAPAIPPIPDPNAVSLGEQLYNKSINTGPFITQPSWESLSEFEKSSWNMQAASEDLQKRNQAIDKERNSYVTELINQEYIKDQQEIYDDAIQLDPNGKYIGEDLIDFDEDKDPLNYVPYTEQEIKNNELDSKAAYINAIRNAEYSDKFKEEMNQRLMPSNYLKVGKDAFGRENLIKGNLQDNINLQAAGEEYKRNLNNRYGSGRISMVYPETLFMGPGAGFAGLTKNLVGKGFRGLGKVLQKNPVNWASRNLVGKELPGWLNYATTPGNVLMGDFLYESFKPDGMVSNFAEGVQDVVNEVPGGRKKIVENSWPLLLGPGIYRGGKNLIQGINQLKGLNTFMPTASNSRFGNYALGYTSPSGNTNILRGNPDYLMGNNIKNFKPSFEFNFPGIGRFQGARYTQPTATGYTRSSNYNPSASNLSLSEGIGSPGYKSAFNNNSYLLGNSKFNKPIDPFGDTDPEIDPSESFRFSSNADAQRQNIAEINNKIIDRTKEEVADLSSPEGIRRLTLNYKNLNPNLNEEEIDHLVATTINEVNAAGSQNIAQYLAQDGSFENMSPKDAENFLDKQIPTDNAYFTPAPFYGRQLRGDIPVHDPNFGLESFRRFGSNASEIISNLGENMKSVPIPTVGTSWFSPIKRIDMWTGALDSQNPVYSPGSISTGIALSDNPTIAHEFGHAIQRTGLTDTDIKLQQLLSNEGIKGFNQRQWNKKVIRDNPGYENVLRAGQDYFYNPKRGFAYESPTNKYNYYLPDEGFPMAREFRQDLLDKGYLGSKYEKITPSILTEYGKSSKPTSDNRSFYMTPPSKYGAFSDILNDMPSWLAPTIGTGFGVGVSLSNEKDGGIIEMNLTEDEAKMYREGGYILEEIN